MSRHTPFIIFFIVFLVAGLIITPDFGGNWDEPAQRDNNGVINYEYITENKYAPLIEGNEKYHGPAFEIFLIVAEKISGFTGYRDIYLLRHRLTFLFFAFSVLIFYRLCLLQTNFRFYSLIATVFLVLSPRIFADSFHNSKDIPFLSMMIIAMYTALLFHRKYSIRSAIYYGIAAGILIDIRVMGIIIPLFSAACLLVDFIAKRNERKKVLATGLVFVFIAFATMVAAWPVLWKNPFYHLAAAFSEMSKYHWYGAALINGSMINVAELPWYYVPFWILVTTPVVYTILFFAGIVYILYRLMKDKTLFFVERKDLLLNVYTFFGPILAVVVFQSVLYDGWRHMFFVYPSFLLIALHGMIMLDNMLSKSNAGIRIFKGVLLLTVLGMTVETVALHPHQYVYFNSLTGDRSEVREKWSMDYWGLSYLQSLKYIASVDSSMSIYVKNETYPAEFNRELLPNHDKDRFRFTPSVIIADYFVSSFRTRPEGYAQKPVYSVMADGMEINAVYDLRPLKEKLFRNPPELAFVNEFPHPSPEWAGGNIVQDSLVSSEYYSHTSSEDAYSTGIKFPYLSVPAGTDTGRVVFAEADVRSLDKWECELIFQVDSADQLVQWKSTTAVFDGTGEWRKLKWSMELDSPDTGLVLKTFIVNSGKNNFDLDNFKVTVRTFSKQELSELQDF